MALAVQAVQGKSAPEKVAALMQYIADNYRYLGDWRKTERGYIPFSLAEIAEHGYGDCKDLSSMCRKTARAKVWSRHFLSMRMRFLAISVIAAFAVV